MGGGLGCRILRNSWGRHHGSSGLCGAEEGSRVRRRDCRQHATAGEARPGRTGEERGCVGEGQACVVPNTRPDAAVRRCALPCLAQRAKDLIHDTTRPLGSTPQRCATVWRPHIDQLALSPPARCHSICTRRAVSSSPIDAPRPSVAMVSCASPQFHMQPATLNPPLADPPSPPGMRSTSSPSSKRKTKSTTPRKSRSKKP